MGKTDLHEAAVRAHIQPTHTALLSVTKETRHPPRSIFLNPCGSPAEGSSNGKVAVVAGPVGDMVSMAILEPEMVNLLQSASTLPPVGKQIGEAGRARRTDAEDAAGRRRPIETRFEQDIFTIYAPTANTNRSLMSAAFVKVQ
jgi:hypothetical protein